MYSSLSKLYKLITDKDSESLTDSLLLGSHKGSNVLKDNSNDISDNLLEKFTPNQENTKDCLITTPRLETSHLLYTNLLSKQELDNSLIISTSQYEFSRSIKIKIILVKFNF